MTDSSRPPQRWTNIGLPTLGTVLIIGLWWGITRILGVEPFYLPAPPDVVDAFSRQPTYLFEQAGITFLETTIGFGIATVGAILLAVLLAASRTVERMTFPAIAGINAVPKVALAPLLMVWVGLNPQAKVLMAIMLCFFPILVATMTGLSSTPADLGEMARSLSASWWQTFIRVRLPWALPQIFIGLKVATSLSIIGAIIGELQHPELGLGSVISSSGLSADTPMAFAALTLLAVMGAALFYSMVALERVLVPWARAISS
ncbi:ABC transporter permease [Plantactinospora sp. B24E8]|uniref:ABC transporter permease n=1 Tax=Plantactinospora sp. B24E8 TaxID=3153567 RepID=UPI00325E164F